MNSIGGYFELELFKGKEYHTEALRLNTARNAFEYCLITRNYKKIFLPFYSCDVLLQPLERLKIPFEFYRINENFEVLFDLEQLEPDSGFVYTNYFGLKNNYIRQISKNCKNLIVDNAQAFFSPPIKSVDTFYSARKFFGVPDGAYLYTDKFTGMELEKEISYNRAEHLLVRLDTTAEKGYPYYTKNEASLDNLPIRKMSGLSQRILQAINYEQVKMKRRENYQYIHEALQQVNEISFPLGEDEVPLAYPFLSKSEALRKKLIENKIYCAQYWSNVLEWTTADSLEYRFAEQLIPLPIDQRSGQSEMDQIVKIIIND